MGGILCFAILVSISVSLVNESTFYPSFLPPVFKLSFLPSYGRNIILSDTGIDNGIATESILISNSVVTISTVTDLSINDKLSISSVYQLVNLPNNVARRNLSHFYTCYFNIYRYWLSFTYFINSVEQSYPNDLRYTLCMFEFFGILW